MLRTALLSGPALALFLLAHPATSAEMPGQVRLEYERQEGAGACPDETAIRTGVAARLGYDPFRERAPDLLRATIRQSGDKLEARIERRDGEGNLRAERRLVSRRRDCSELASSVELAIAIAIDPIASSPAPAPATPPRVSTPAAAEPGASSGERPAPPEAALPAPAPRIGTWLAAAVLGGAGSAPGPNLGLLMGGGIMVDRYSIGVEGRADWPAAKELRAGEASAQLLVGSLVPCVHIDRASLCGLATAGVRRVGGHGLVDQRNATLTYVGLGGRLGLALPLADHLDLTLHGDVTAPLTRTRLTVDDQVVWTSPAVAVALAAGVAMRFP